MRMSCLAAAMADGEKFVALALTRTTTLFSVALTVPLMAGCPNAGSAPPLPENRSFTPAPIQPLQTLSPVSPEPLQSEAPAPSDAPTSQSPAPEPEPSSSVDAPATPEPTPFGGPTTSLQGKVYDEKGSTVDGATVTVRSLSEGSPFEATTEVVRGTYILKAVPEGVQLEVSVGRPGWTRRSRVTVLQAVSGVVNEMDFGSLASETRSEGAPYFISDYPEVVSALPTPETRNAETVSYSVRFSEPLGEAARELVERAFQIDSLPSPVELQPAGLSPVQKAERVALIRGSSFLDSTVRLEMAWDDAQEQLRVTFPVPLRQSKDETVGYRFQLLRRQGDGLIEDAGGRALGVVSPDEGQAYFAVRKGDLALAAADTTGELRWQATHQRSSSFAVEKDTVPPVLQGVTANEASQGGVPYYRFDLTFSKPMRVYPDERGYTESLTNLENYVFALSTRTLDGVKMDGDVGTFTTDDTAANFVLGFADPRRPFTFVDPADSDETNDAYVRIKTTDPKVVSVYVPRAALPTNLSQVKVRVKKDLLDPAGNGMSEANVKSDTNTADNIVTGRF